MSNNRLSIDQQLEKFPKSWPKFVAIFLSIVIIYILISITITFKGINPKGLMIALSAFKGLFTPSLSLITNLTQYGLLYMLFETLAIAFLGSMKFSPSASGVAMEIAFCRSLVHSRPSRTRMPSMQGTEGLEGITFSSKVPSES